MKKRLIWVVVLVLLGGGGWLAWKHTRPGAAAGTPTAGAAATAKVRVKVERGNIRAAVASSGRVVSNQDVDVKCKAGGQIVTMPFEISDTVKVGDLLVELDPVDEQRKVKQAEVQLAASQAKLAAARESLAIAELTLKTDRRRADAAFKAAESHAQDAQQKAARVRDLLAKNLVSQEEDDTAETQAVQAAADLEGAKIRAEELTTQERALELKRQEVALAQAAVDGDTIIQAIAKDRLHDTRVLSPIDGVVGGRQVQPGQIIASATSNVGGGTALLTLCDLSRIFVVASVDETDIGKVQVGQKANVTVDAFPGRPFPGEIVRVAVKGVNASNVVTFEVRIEVTGKAKNLLKLEMTANVEIVTAQKDDVLTLPVEAVRRKGREQLVDKVTGPADGSTTTIPVTIGMADAAKVEIVSGLAEGDEVSYAKGSDSGGKWSGRNQGGPPRGMMMPMGGMPRR